MGENDYKIEAEVRNPDRISDSDCCRRMSWPPPVAQVSLSELDVRTLNPKPLNP